MALDPNAVVRVAARYALSAGQDHVNVYYLQNIDTSAIGNTAVVDAVVEWLQNAYNEIETNLTNSIVIRDVKIDEVEFIGGDLTVVQNIGTGLWAGGVFDPTGSTDPLPPGAAALVKFLTDKGKIYGRKFIGGVVEVAQSAGILESGFLAQLAAFGAKILLNAVTSTSQQLRAGVMSTAEAGFVDFKEVDVSNIVAYQRRRRQGTGS